ncbi:MAG: energy-coupled thiamine transporter ThiT [Clostridia bacterium]|nr:energy-coupled thiamine transporter ThiT [Clostridia bacterium]
MKQRTNLLRLVESALLLAVAAVLSMVKVLDLPYGGSITAFSALPMLLVAYRHGVPWGLFTGFAYSLIQLLLGLNTLSYATSPLAAVAIIVLDYLLAFTALGLGGVFRRRAKTQGTALVLGALLTGGLRYVFHVVAGCTVWAGLSIPTEAALLYSLAYNATYMLPETLVTTLGAWYFSKAVDIREALPRRAAPVQTLPVAPLICSLLSKAALLAAAVWDIRTIFKPLQDPETGDFVITNLTLVDWQTAGIVTAVGVILWLGLWLLQKHLQSKQSA